MPKNPKTRISGAPSSCVQALVFAHFFSVCLSICAMFVTVYFLVGMIASSGSGAYLLTILGVIMLPILFPFLFKFFAHDLMKIPHVSTSEIILHLETSQLVSVVIDGFSLQNLGSLYEMIVG